MPAYALHGWVKCIDLVPLARAGPADAGGARGRSVVRHLLAMRQVLTHNKKIKFYKIILLKKIEVCCVGVV